MAVTVQMRYSAKAGGNVSWLAFVYRRQGQLVNVKYRSMNKEFIQVWAAAACPVSSDSRTSLHVHGLINSLAEHLQASVMALQPI